jgi:L-lactate dehydrogenase complex protein LldG
MNREAFLARVRSALQREAGAPVEGAPPVRFPHVVYRPDELTGIFKMELELVGGHVHHTEDPKQARDVLRTLLQELKARSFIRSADPVVDSLLEGVVLPQAERPADADVGITGVLAAIANTGTLVLTSEAGRKASLLPMTHIALVHEEQIVPGMAQALERHAQELPSAWVQATGPSRTADIELTLTTGVHGPGVVHVLLMAKSG